MSEKVLVTSDVVLPTMATTNFQQIATGMIKATSSSPEVAKFRINHTKRVAALGSKLALTEPLVDPVKVKVMCLVHDMYKYTSEADHGKMAAVWLKKFMVEPYLKRSAPFMSKKKFLSEKSDWEHVYDALSKHSDKALSIKECRHSYIRILMDADVLDKIAIEYITQWNDLFYDPEIVGPDNLLPIMAKMIQKVNKYEGKSNGYYSVKNNLLLVLLNNIQQEIYDDRANGDYYRSFIYPLLPKKLQGEVDIEL